MADLKTIIFASVCILLTLAIIEFGSADAARGGRFGGSRARYSTRVRYGTRVRYSRARYGSTRVRYGSNRVRYGSTRVRIRTGSSPYNRGSFYHAMTAGYIYGSLPYMRTSRYRRYPDRMPTICTNNYDTAPDNNGSVYGYFICPRVGEPDNFEYCCGDPSRETCCQYFAENDQGRTAGIVIGVLLVIIIVGICIYCACKRSGKGAVIVRKFSSKKNGDVKQYGPVHTDPGPVNMVPVPAQPVQPGGYPQPPPPQHQGGYPQPPNPAYNQPYPPSAYPPPYSQPQPTGFDSTVKQPLTEGYVDAGGLPYSANPAPYPAANPYPPPGVNPYPPPTDGQYPPPGVSPYPPTGASAPPPPQGYNGTGPGYPVSPPPPYPQ